MTDFVNFWNVFVAPLRTYPTNKLTFCIVVLIPVIPYFFIGLSWLNCYTFLSFVLLDMALSLMQAGDYVIENPETDQHGWPINLRHIFSMLIATTLFIVLYYL
jgi:hypothetical protein